MLKDYKHNGFFDEMLTEHGSVRSHYERFCSLLESISPDEYAEKRHSIEMSFLRQGITFNVYGDSQGAERIFPFDLMPRVIPAKEWEHLERGLIQRITALNLFLRDIYHEQKIVKDGVIPPFYILSGKNVERRNDAIFDNLLLVVDVPQEKVQGGDALDQSALQMLPFLGGNDAGHQVKWKNPLGALGVSIDVEGDPLAEERHLDGMALLRVFIRADGFQQ